jgi:hypothetical protein
LNGPLPHTGSTPAPIVGLNLVCRQAIVNLDAERVYNDIIHQYHHSLILHRRSMLRINSAVGQRNLP